MDAFLTQPVERQRVLYEEAGRRLGLSAGSVEKDLWVAGRSVPSFAYRRPART